MHDRRITIFLFFILIFSIFPLIEIDENSAETITNSIKWDGVKEIDSDVIVKSGAILTIANDSIIIINSDVSFSIEGTLIIEGIGLSGVQFMANISQQSEVGIKSNWKGIEIKNSGVAEINGLSLDGTQNGITTNVGSNLRISNSVISDSIQGILNFGAAEIENLNCINIQNNCINNHGLMNLDNIFSNNSGQLLKNHNSGTFANLSSNNTGVVIEMSSNSTGSIKNIDANNSGLVIRAYGDQKNMFYEGINVNSASRLFDFSNSENLSIDDITGIQIGSVLLANSVNYLQISNMEISESESVGLGIEVLSSSYVNITDTTIYGFGQSFLFSGGGNFSLINTNFYSNGKVGQLSSSTMHIRNGDWEGSQHGLHTEYSFVSIDKLNISIGNTHGTALRFLGSTISILEGLNLSHDAQWSDSTSIGLQSIWSDITADYLNVSGFSTGVSCETTSTLKIDYLSIVQNTNIGYFQSCSESQISTLFTNSGTNGLYSKNGLISIHNWNASSHTDSLLFSEHNAKTYVRNWQATGFTFAAKGAASELFYGSYPDETDQINENLILIDGAEKYVESTIEVTDLSGLNYLQGIEVSVHNFIDVSDFNGIVTLPLVSIDSDVNAIDIEKSVSRIKSLSKDDINLRIELPLLPEDGSNWVIESDVDVVLDGFNGELLSDITILEGGSLNLIESSLTALNITIESGGVLVGSASTINGEKFSISSTLIGDESSSLRLEGLIEITCDSTSMNWNGISLSGEIEFMTNNNCELSLFGGELVGTTSISQGGTIVQFTNLHVNVLDKGEPISSAQVFLDGAQGNNELISATTDILGKANLRAKSLTYTEDGVVGDINLDRIVTMYIQSQEITQINYWDVSYNSEMTFVASTLNTDEVQNYLNLDLQWSPYYLFDNLLVSGLMQINDGVDLQIATGKEIIVNGQLDIGSASLHGDDWSGIIVNNGEIYFEGSNILNAVQSLILENGAFGEISRSTFSNSIEGHVLLNSGSIVNVNNSLFELGDECIKTSNDPTIIVEISYSNISLCGMGIRASGAEINLNEIQMYTIGAGIRLIDITGNLKNISIDGNFELFNGIGNAPITVISDMIGMEIIDHNYRELIISNITIDMTNLGFLAENSLGLDVHNLDVPKIMFVRTSGQIADLDSDEIIIENTRSSEPLELKHVNANFVNITGNSGQSCIGFSYSEINTVTINDICVDILESEISMLKLNTSYFSQSVTSLSTISTIIVEVSAELIFTYNHNFIAELNGETVDANFELSQENKSENVLFKGSQEIELIWKRITSEGIVDMSNSTLNTTFNGALPNSDDVLLVPDNNSTIIYLQVNPSPIVALIFPDGLNDFSEGLEVTSLGTINEVNFTISDEHGINSISWNLLNLGSNEEISSYSSDAFSLSELLEGEYVLSIIVIDNYGATTIISEEFIISPSDNDGDNLISCVSSLWWDDSYQRHCGPDRVDKDDDNDGYIDSIDAFPLDNCAFEDTDSDGQPDNIIQECDTNLVLDLDSDGNGILDANEISLKSNESNNGGIIIVFLLLIVIVGSALLRRYQLNGV